MKTLSTPSRRQMCIECLVLLALAAVLRVWFVGKTDLGYDESFSLYMALQSVPDLVRMLCQGDNPPLWELLLHFWVKVFGISEVAIRSLSLIFSVLTVIPIYLVGEKYLHRFAGIAASLCYCFSTFSIYLAHDCRVYSLLGCCTAFSLLLFISAVHQPKPFKFILLTLVNLMLMYGHYLSVWTIVMEFLIVMLVKPIRKRIWKPYLIHAAALLVLFAPMFPVLFTRFFDSGIHGTWIAKTTGPEALYDLLWRMCNVPVTTVLALVILLATFIMFIYKVFRKKCEFGNTAVISLLWLVPLLVSFVLSFFTGFFLDRYFYFLFPVFYLAIVAYCSYLFPRKKALAFGLMGLFTIAMAVFCSPNSATKRFSGWHADVKPVVNQIVEAKENQTLVILPEYFEKQFVYYLDEEHEIFRSQNQPTNYYVFREYLNGQGYYYDNDYRNANLAACSTVVVPYRDTMPVKGLREYLESAGFHLDQEHDAYPYVVSYFTK